MTNALVCSQVLEADLPAHGCGFMFLVSKGPQPSVK